MTFRNPYRAMLVIWAAILFFPAAIWGQISTQMDRANHLYNQSRYGEAVDLYEQLVAGSMKNGHLHYNLGNAYFRMENLPKAILHYVKAQNLLPRNEDVEANLEYALRQTEDHVGLKDSQDPSGIFFWTRDFSLIEHLLCLFWVNLIFWASMAVNLRRKTPAMRSTRNFLLIVLVLVSISTGLRWHQETRQIPGVVIPQQVDVHSGWNSTTPVLFQLHQGTVVSISRDKENWYEIELPDAQKGWLLKSSVAK